MRPILLSIAFLAACKDDPDTDIGLDADGDGLIGDDDCDDDDAAVGGPDQWYHDSDGDGHGAGDPFDDCGIPEGASGVADDCDDGNFTVNPDGNELCNGVDDDCDAAIDDDASDAETLYTDADGDRHGDPSTGAVQCPGEGLTDRGDDCDDGDPNRAPGLDEVCNLLDDDCDGDIDEDAIDAGTWYPDVDGDGHGAALGAIEGCPPEGSWSQSGDDCDDGDPGRFPGNPEMCGGGDEDCDGRIDEEDAADMPWWYVDADADGYGDIGGRLQACVAPSGYAGQSGDCDEGNPDVNPGADEICAAGDENCDPTDDDHGVDQSAWYPDLDGDGFGTGASIVLQCSQPGGYADNPSDCDDADDAAYPGADETCDGSDDDCDGVIDDDPTDARAFYADADQDGHGDGSTAIVACTGPSGSVTVGDDCDDGREEVHPGAPELCDNRDNDCSGRWQASDEAGTASLEGATWIDLTSAFANGTAVIAEEGELWICTGTYDVEIQAAVPLHIYSRGVVTLDGGGAHRLITGTDVEIDGILLQNGSASDGGAIYASGDLAMSGVGITGSDAARGSAVYVANGDFEMSGSTIESNTGGPALSITGSARIYTSEIASNPLGALVIDGTTEIVDTTFEGNGAQSAIYGSATIGGGSSFADEEGGLLVDVPDGGTLDLDTVDFSAGHSGGSGGQLVVIGSGDADVTLDTVTFTDGASDQSGGAVWIDLPASAGTVSLVDVTITGATAAQTAGGARIRGGLGDIVATNLHLDGTYAARIGGADLQANTVTIDGSRVEYSSAASSPAGLYVEASDVVLTDTIFNVCAGGSALEIDALTGRLDGLLAATNDTPGYSAAMLLRTGAFTMKDTQAYLNDGAALMLMDSATLDAEDCRFTQNDAPDAAILLDLTAGDLTCDQCDLGRSPYDNAPHDLLVDGTFYDYDDSETIACSVSGGCVP